MFDRNSSMGYGLNEFNKFNIGNADFLKFNSRAKDLGLEDSQIVESRYELDGSEKKEKDFIERQNEISKMLGKAAKSDKSEEFDHGEKVLINNHSHNHKKGDGFDGDCPLCECETCKNRRYQDQSNDTGVSFQSATKISPEAAASRVKAHENEHVRREQYKARQEGKRVVSQSVQIYMRNCPECGKPYVAGGLTITQTKTKVDGYYDALLGNEQNLEKFNAFDVSS
ncbi:MAG: hypothetical protein LBR74_01440 [Eubacterium sp.]|nr:hypothetical protein [Eubacterium sp.]